MKILIWLPAGFLPAIGGIESLTYTLSTGLAARGHKVVVIAFQAHEEFSAYEEHLGFEIYRFKAAILLSPQELIDSYKKVHELVRFVSPDIIHLQYTPNTILVFYFLLIKKLNVPIVVTNHGFLNIEFSDLNSRIERSAGRIVFVSKYLMGKVVKGTKESVIQNAITISEHSFVPASFAPPRLLCLGRLTSEKGYDLAINAFAKLTQTHPHAELILVGDGIEKDNLVQLTHSLGIQDQVKFMPAKSYEECLALLQDVSAVIIPSRYESFGLVALEAGMSGRPVVAFNVGGLPEIIIDGVTGVLVEPENINALCDAMRDLIDSPQLAVKIGKAAYTHIRKNFSSNTMISQYELIYETTRSEHHDRLQRELLAERIPNATSPSCPM